MPRLPLAYTNSATRGTKFGLRSPRGWGASLAGAACGHGQICAWSLRYIHVKVRFEMYVTLTIMKIHKKRPSVATLGGVDPRWHRPLVVSTLGGFDPRWCFSYLLLAVSNDVVDLLGSSTVLRPSSSVVQIASPDVSFTLVNSDHFVNIHSALLHGESDGQHIDGLLGQTAAWEFEVKRTAEFKQHIEADFLIPAGDDDLWSTSFEHSKYVHTANAS